MRDRFLMWRFERQAAKRYAHMRDWDTCYRLIGGFCVRCLVRQLSGTNKRAKARRIARFRGAS